MKAVTWHGKRDVRVDDVPDPRSRKPTDAIIESRPPTSADRTCICTRCSGRSWTPATSSATSRWASSEVGSDVARPHGRATGWSSRSRSPAALLHVRPAAVHPVRDHPGPRHGMGAALFGYSKLYGEVPGGQAEYLRVPQAQFTPIKVPDGPPTSATSTCPTCCRPPGRPSSTPPSPTAASSPCSAWARSATWRPDRAAPRGGQVIGVDLVPERLHGRAPGVETIDLRHDGRPRRRDPRPDRRTRTGLGHRRRRHGGARIADRQARPAGRRAAAGRAGRSADAEGRRRPAERAHSPSTSCGAAAPSR